MLEKYGSTARAALMALMLANREVPNPELASQYKIKLNPTDRGKLIDEKLLQTSMDTRPYIHRITDKGIEWCMADLVKTAPPPRSGPLVRASFELLRRLVMALRQRGILAEAIRFGGLESLIRE